MIRFILDCILTVSVGSAGIALIALLLLGIAILIAAIWGKL